VIGFRSSDNLGAAYGIAVSGMMAINLMETSFIIGREKLRLKPRKRRMQFWRWRDQLFILMSNNTLDATEFFRIPPNRVVELGGQIEI
jgi:KUP system potassium uptake protein